MARDIRVRLTERTWRRLNARRRSTEETAGDVVERLLDEVEDEQELIADGGRR